MLVFIENLSDEYHMPGFKSFFKVLHHFVLVKLFTSSIRFRQFAQIDAFMKGIIKIVKPLIGTAGTNE